MWYLRSETSKYIRETRLANEADYYQPLAQRQVNQRFPKALQNRVFSGGCLET
jgi:hypothetical protein